MYEVPTGAAAPSLVDGLVWLARRKCEGVREFFWHREDNLERFARRELEIAGMFDKDGDYGGALGPAIMKMMRAFSKEGHSGFSASMALNAFKRVAAFEPLTPLTGADDEWLEYLPGHFQNTRCGHVFKDGEAGAYDSTGKIFREPSGACFSSSESRAPVTFPYTPVTEYIDVAAS